MRPFREGRLVSESSEASPRDASGNVFTRSWARISGRRRKHRPPPIEEASEVTDDPGPSTSSQQIPWRLASTPEKPKPFLNRGMDKIRRSIRKSFRKTPSLTADTAGSAGAVDDGTALKTPWALDEKAVRQGICKFNVKYLGCCEVYESRGVHVCEGALQHLKNRKRTTKAILYISGDGLRVVDRESNRGLIVDQTIEKVSFCAPDRHCEKGFAYICREGATRRWMCHGFLTTKESGERVSHAVGCAFTICLEQKKKREIELTASRGVSQQSTSSSAKYPDLNDVWNAPTPTPPESNGFAKNNLAYASFRRQLSISERKQDPQTAIVNDPPPSTSARSTINESTIKPRPQANPALFDRQGSFRAPAVPQQAFKRFNSLRTDLLSRPNLDSTRLLNTEPIYEGDEWPETSLSSNPLPVSTSLQFNHIAEGNKENGSSTPNWSGILNPTCQSTPVHSSRIMEENKTSSNKADEWLEQTFKSLSVKNSDSERSISTLNNQLRNHSIDLIDFSSTPSSTVPPPIPQGRPVIYDQVPGDTVTGAQKPNISGDTVSEVQKTHARKGSSTKKIEYQLLEEIDAPVSPPRTTPAPGVGTVDAFGQPAFNPPTPRSGPSISDPFDVQWSEAVLKQTANGTESSRYRWIDRNLEIEKALTKNYNRKHRPVKQDSTVMQVEVFLMINHVEKVDEREQTILLHGQLSASWKDEYLTWNPADYNNTGVIAIDSNNIWQPSFALYNSARSNGWYLYMQGVPATVLSSGRVYSTGSFTFYITCYFDFANYPYDEQECPIVIADWVYDLSKINLSDAAPDFYNKPVIRLSFDPANDGAKKHVAGWEIQDTWKKHCYWGPTGCMEKIPNGPLDTFWSLLEFGIKLKRHAPYYGLTILLPSIVTVCLTLTVFWIDDYPMAMSIAIFDVLLQGLCSWSLLKELPPSNGKLPKIAYFCAFNFILAALAYCLHCVINFLLSIIPGDIELPFQLTNITEKLRKLNFFKVEGLSFDPQKVLLGEEVKSTVDPFEDSKPNENSQRETIFVEMEDPVSSSEIIPLEETTVSEQKPPESEVSSMKKSISTESHLAEEIYTVRRIIFAIYLSIYVVLIPWLLF